jgi:anti-sigma factor RsiW
MKACIRYAPMIGAREGELSEAEASALAAHLEACPRCDAIAADLAATEGLVSEALMAAANARDFAPFVDGVMARIERPAAARAAGGVLAWAHRHWKAAAGALAPALAALALFMYVRVDHRPEEVALFELAAEGRVATVLETPDGPVVLLAPEESGS